MNKIRAIQALNERELEAGISDAASWHADYADTAYIYIGGLPFELSEGDIITIFSQFGEPAHLNLVRDKETGKSRGFAFLKYEDQRSTNLAVDNLSGANILGRIISVDHCRYKHKEGEEEVDLGAVAGISRGEKGKSDDDDGDNGGQGRESTRKRRRRHRDGEHKEDGHKEEPQRPPTEKEKELMKLMGMDDDDPLKEYLIKEKKEEIELERQSEHKKSRRSRDEKSKETEERRHRHRSQRHRSPSEDRDRSRRHSRERRRERDRSKERRQSPRENKHKHQHNLREMRPTSQEPRRRSGSRHRERRH